MMPLISIRSFVVVALLLSAVAPYALAQDPPPDAAGAASQPRPYVLDVAGLIQETSDRDGWTRTPRAPWRIKTSTNATTPSAVPAFATKEKHGDRTEFVLADEPGPGAFLNLAVSKAAGTLRVYCDEEPAPVIEMDLALVMTGKITIFSGPFTSAIGEGGVLRFPIPFRKRGKVTVDQDGFFYAVDTRLHEAATPAESFRMKEAIVSTFRTGPEIGRLMEPASTLRLDAFDPRKTAAGTTEVVVPKSVKAGERAVVFAHEAKSPAAVDLLGVVDPGGTLASVADWATATLSIAVDGKKTFDDVPLAHALASPYESGSTAFSGIAEDAAPQRRLSALMPFRRTIEITVANRGEKPIENLFFLVRVVPYDWDARSRHLHALTRTAADAKSDGSWSFAADRPSTGALVAIVRSPSRAEGAISTPLEIFASGGAAIERTTMPLLRWYGAAARPFESKDALDHLLADLPGTGAMTAFVYLP